MGWKCPVDYAMGCPSCETYRARNFLIAFQNKYENATPPQDKAYSLAQIAFYQERVRYWEARISNNSSSQSSSRSGYSETQSSARPGYLGRKWEIADILSSAAERWR